MSGESALEDPSIEIRRATVGDLPAVQAFITDTYKQSAPFKNGSRWVWQFVDNPFRPAGDAGPTVWIAVNHDRVVGQIAVQDGAVFLHGTRVEASWIVDVMIHPDFRGLGLGHRLHASVMQDRNVLITLTMAPATRRIAERADCLTLGPTRQYVYMHRLSRQTVQRYLLYKEETRPDIARLLRLFRKSVIGPVAVAAMARLATRILCLRGGNIAARQFDFDEVAHFPDELDQLWANTREAFPAIFERSAKFLNWRFCDCPDLHYRRFLMRASGQLRGYVIIRCAPSVELPAGIIVDVFTRPDDKDAIKALLTHARDMMTAEVEYLEAAASTPAFEQALQQLGFIGARSMHPTIVCGKASLKAEFATSLDEWHFTKADHDWDQIHPA